MRRLDAEPQRRRSPRLRGFDYGAIGWYFITICTHNREPLFGEVADGALVPSVIGEVVADEWWRTGDRRPGIDLDAFVLMPNHLHGIVVIREGSDTEERAPGLAAKDAIGTLSAVVRGFKGATTRRVRDELGGDGTSFWQRSFYDHIIRDERDPERIRTYIVNNPANWTTDAEYRPRHRGR